MIEADLDALFTTAGYRGMVSVVDIDGPGRVALRENEQAYAASAFKTTVALELYCQCADGELDPAQRVTITPAEQTFGGQGLCLFTDDAEISLRDLARLMLTISDNTATDAVIRHVGAQRITARLNRLGLTRTHVTGTIREHFDAIGRELGYADLAEHHQALADAPEPQAAAMRARFRQVFTRPGLAPCTSAGEMARLIAMIWRDRAGPAQACAQLRTLLGQQRLTRKIATGFPDHVTVAAKSGTVPGVISNDAGAVLYPDGHRYAVAILTQALDPATEPDGTDPPIGTAARMAVDHLRRNTA
jgi:beta-lactamase class A